MCLDVSVHRVDPVKDISGDVLNNHMVQSHVCFCAQWVALLFHNPKTCSISELERLQSSVAVSVNYLHNGKKKNSSCLI